MTKVDLQALIDMPGAVNAQKALIKAGKWTQFLTDTERMDWLEDCRVKVTCPETENHLFTVSGYNPFGSYLRDAIDTQARKEGTA